MADPLVTIDLNQGRIIIGGNGEELVRLFTSNQPAGSEGANPAAPAHQQPLPTGLDHAVPQNGNRASVRDFAKRFAHRKLYERIVVLLYYANRVDGRSSLTTKELRDWFGLCGFETPTRMDKALDNMRYLRHLIERTGPGDWSLNTAGENVALEVLESPEANGSP
jgi:hypothetical protein